MRRLGCGRSIQGDVAGRLACRAGTGGSVLARGHNREPAGTGSGSVTEVLVASPDLASFAAPYIRNSDLPERLRLGAPPAEPERTTFQDGDCHGCPDYPGWHGIA